MRWAGKEAPTPWLHMIRVAIGGPVPRAVWRQRYRTCLRCPLFNGSNRACSSTHPKYMGLGCKCLTWLKALFARPYPEGCYGRSLDDSGEIGWGPYHHPTIWHRLWAPFRFLLGR